VTKPARTTDTPLVGGDSDRDGAARSGGAVRPGDAAGRPGPEPAAPRLAVAPRLLARAREAARAALPAEACGLLLGRVDGERTLVQRLESTRNATASPAEDTFEVHPEDYLRLDALARSLGLDVVGVWHSHPDSAARPSRTDLERAWPGWSYLIVGRAAHDDAHERSWRLDDDGRFVEERLVTAGEAPAPRTTQPTILR